MVRKFSGVKIKGFFGGGKNFAFSQQHELFHSTMDMQAYMESGVIREKLEKYDASGKLIGQLDLSEMNQDISRFYENLENAPDEFESIHSLFCHRGQLIVSTVNNRNYIFENDSLKYTYAHDGLKDDLDPKKGKDIFAQTQNFASHFYPAQDNKLYFRTSGSDFGRTNDRDRYIVGISDEEVKTFGEAPFASHFCIDLWDRTDKIPPRNMKVESYSCGRLARSMQLTFPMIFQVLDLDDNYFLVSVFSDNQSKAASPDKNTPYYFFKIEKAKGSISRNIAPKDSSVYRKGAHYMLINDRENKVLQFKTNDYLHFIKYSGIVRDSIDLKQQKLSKLRNLVMLEKVEDTTYFFNEAKSEVVGFELGSNAEEVVANYKQYSKGI